ncbi:hypothetical protein MANES_11G118937v8, partial [Manihot esculenta]
MCFLAKTLSKLFQALLLLIFLSTSASTATSALTDGPTKVGMEAYCLLRWKASLDNQSQSVLDSWVGRGPCKWIRVNCDSFGSITILSLINFGLRGTLHSFNFSCFPNLTRLEIWNNLLHGTLPSQISNLSKIAYLDLSGNHLTGNIPSEIGMLIDLHTLALSKNLFDGHIPAEFGMLSSLSELYLSSNNFIGLIPTSMTKLENISILYLWRNKLSDSIPPEIGFLKSLKSLDLS